MLDISREKGITPGANPSGSPYDVVVVGGGPAGLSAALLLGRCRRTTVVVDDGRPRNYAARHLHGLLGHDGTSPDELAARAREQLRPYGVEQRDGRVVSALRAGELFELLLADGARLRARRVVLATGVRDRLPTLPGFEELYGVSAHHCPFCDGWEERDRPIAVHARGPSAAEFAVLLSTWSADVVLCADGEPLSAVDVQLLARAGVKLRPEPIARLEGRRGRLERVVFRHGEPLAREALFFHLGTEPASDLARGLGCRYDEAGRILTHDYEETSVPGVYAVGDATEDVMLIVRAAAEGASAAAAIHESLLLERLARRDQVAPGGRA